MTDEIIQIFQDFVIELLLSDQLHLARILRKKLINKIEKKRLSSTSTNYNLKSRSKNSSSGRQLLLLPVNNISFKYIFIHSGLITGRLIRFFKALHVA